jgi:hypothetical protein
MRPSELEAIRPHLEKAIQEIDRWFARRQDHQEGRRQTLEWFERMEKAREDARKAHREYRQPERTVNGEPEHHLHLLLLTCWPDDARQASDWLRRVGLTVEADAIDMKLANLTDREHPEYSDDNISAMGDAAQRVKTILTACLAGAKNQGGQPQADKPAAAGGAGESAIVANPAPPSSLAELPEWITTARELLRGQEDGPLGDSGIGRAVREQFLAHLERLFPAGLPDLYEKSQPDKFQTVRELAMMMLSVGNLLRTSEIPPEDQEKKRRIGFGLALEPEWRFACRGTVYQIAGCGERTDLPWMTGLGYIEKLIRRPGEAIPFAELVASDAPESATEAAEQTANESLELDEWSDQPAVDKQARREYHDRLEAIKTELEDAQQCNDPGRKENLEREREAILAAVRKSTGLGNKPRDINDDTRRPYHAVVTALKRAYQKLEKAGSPKLAAHFQKEISTTGGVCKYTADPRPPWSFDLL